MHTRFLIRPRPITLTMSPPTRPNQTAGTRIRCARGLPLPSPALCTATTPTAASGASPSQPPFESRGKPPRSEVAHCCGLDFPMSMRSVVISEIGGMRVNKKKFSPMCLQHFLLSLQRSPLFCANTVEKDPSRARQTSSFLGLLIY